MDDGGTPTDGWRLPSMATGLVLTEDHRLVAVLDDGLWVLDPDARTAEQLCGNPPGIDGRCNDARADLDGNLVTGKLNLGPAPGAVWWYSARAGWRLLDDRISNTNGPGAAEIDGRMTLVVGDTAAHYYAYDYDPSKATATNRRVFGDVTGLEGRPDGACFDREATLWTALFGGGRLGRFGTEGLIDTVSVPARNPTDVACGGRELDRLFVTTVAARDGGGGAFDGALLVIDWLGIRGRPEPRFAL